MRMLHIIENRKYFIGGSLAVLLIGIIVIIINAASGRGAFYYGVDFTGGTSFQININKAFNNDDIARIVQDVTGQEAPVIQKVANVNEVMINIKSVDQATREKLIQQISAKYGITADAFTYSDISATVSADMQRTAVEAVVLACAAMLIYISARFRNLRLGSAAIISLLHDVFIMVVFYAILRIPINYTFIATILTILGYSVNATIVIFDRVRENRTLMRRAPLMELINTSITQTMRRSIFTLITVFIVLLVLYILGVSSIKEFALPIIIGVIAGGYSSIFLAGSFLYMFSAKPSLAQAQAQAGKPAAQAQASKPAASTPKPAAPLTPAAAAATGVSQASGAAADIRQLSSTRRKKNKRR